MKSDHPEFDFNEGKYRALEGMSRAERSRLGRAWSAKATAWLDKQKPLTEFTSDDIVKEIGLPGTLGNKAVGAWFGAMSKKGRIKFIRVMHKSARVARHAGDQRVWKVAL